MLAAGWPTQGTSVHAEQSLQKWMDLVQRGASAEELQKAETELAEAMQKSPFEVAQRMPFFLKLVQKLEGNKAYQQFHLPGSDRVVVDRREQFEGRPEQPADDAGKKAAEETARETAKEATREKGEELKKKPEMRMRQGKLVKDKGRMASLAARGAGPGADQGAATARVERMLSAFERMVIARFEKGAQVAKESADGKAHFAAKTEGQWKQFFKNFLSRTVKKRALLNDIRSFLMRGAVAKGGKGVAIGDMHFSSGRVEKFVRFSILAEALAKFAAMKPGEMMGKGALKDLTGEELMYLALAASRGREFATTKKPEQGRFMGGKAEALAAQKLGLTLDDQLREKARRMRQGKKGGSGAFGDLLGEHIYGEDAPTRFIPWWHWANITQFGGKRRWVSLVFYASLILVALMGIIAMTVRLISAM